MDWIQEISDHKDHNTILSFQEYMESYFNKSPKKFCRPTCIYFRDMFDHFGKNAQGDYSLFKESAHNSPPVQGQTFVQNEIHEKLSNFVDEGFNNKFILLVGPNGSSKSSIIKKIMLAAENYSKSTEGQLFTFSWIFPVDSFVKGSLGFANITDSKKLDTYAYLDQKDISSILGSDLKDHPLLLIPLERRRKIIENALSDDQDFLDSIKKSYLYNSDLSKRNKLIFDELLRMYKGDFLQIYKHIRVERFTIDKKFSTAAVTIEPQMHVDANIQQITMDKRIGSLPTSLQSLNLFSLSGPLVMANRGILEFSDLLKRPLDAFKYLLTTMETHSINLSGIMSELDVFFVGTTNEIHFNAFKQHPDFNSFRARFNVIKVPYLLDYKLEEKIYTDQIHNLKDRCHFETHALRSIALWATMTRLRKPIGGNLSEPKHVALLSKLNPLEKAIFISDKIAPESFSSKEKQNLISIHEEVCEEFLGDMMYEGKFGVSPRDVKQIIYDLGSENKTVSFVEVIEYLREFAERKGEFDFLNIAPQGAYHDSLKFCDLIEAHVLSIFDTELRQSLGLVDNRSYEEYIGKYVHQVKAYIKKEKVRNPVTNKYEECDMYFINEFEKNISIQESPDEFRSHIISKYGAYSIDNPGKEVVMSDVFQNIAKALQESFRNEQVNVIDGIGENLVLYINNPNSLSGNDKKQVDEIIDKLSKEFGYSRIGAMNMIQYILKKMY